MGQNTTVDFIYVLDQPLIYPGCKIQGKYFRHFLGMWKKT